MERMSEADLFKDVVYVVEATSTEQHFLWQIYSMDNSFPTPNLNPYAFPWKGQSSGFSFELGKLNRRPMHICIIYDILLGQKIMFYYGSSQVVDHKMIDDFINKNLHIVRSNSNNRIGHPKTNAMNFNNCIFDLMKLNNGK